MSGRDPATRAGFCAGAGLVAFVGFSAALSGNALPALIEFALVTAVFALATGLARRGRI